MTSIEVASTGQAAAGGSDRAFPAGWGPPVGSRWSGERARWVRQKVGEHSMLTAHAKQAAIEGRLLALRRRADLLACRYPPGRSAA